MKKDKPAYNQKGQPGLRWGVLKKFMIHSKAGDLYLTRWRVLATPFFNIMLHRIDGPDPDFHPHDHPWAFISLVLKGGYHEKVVTPGPKSYLDTQEYKHHKWFSFHKMPQGLYHKIIGLDGRPVWTLVLTGPRRSDWGFLTPTGHVPWKQYLIKES